MMLPEWLIQVLDGLIILVDVAVLIAADCHAQGEKKRSERTPKHDSKIPILHVYR